MYKFSRDVIFAVLADNLSFMKIKSSKFLNNDDAYGAQGMIYMILKNKTAGFRSSVKLCLLKICMYTVYYVKVKSQYQLYCVYVFIKVMMVLIAYM